MTALWERRSTQMGILLMIVITIIAVFAKWQKAVVLTVQLEYERHARIISDIHALDCQIEAFRRENGALPTTLAPLKHVPKDPWGSEYVLLVPGVHNRGGYDLFSAGGDKKTNTPDDDWGE